MSHAHRVGTCDKGLKVYLNGERIPIRSFKEYVGLHLTKQPGEEAPPMVHEIVNDRYGQSCHVDASRRGGVSSYVFVMYVMKLVYLL